MVRQALTLLFLTCSGMVYAGGWGCLPKFPHCQKESQSCGCHSCKTVCSDCCQETETIVIHCGNEGSIEQEGQENTGRAQQSDAGTTLLMPNYSFGAAAPQQMMPMAMMPMYGGMMAPPYHGGGYGYGNQSREFDRQDKRLTQLEDDFRQLTSQVDRIVDSVDANTRILEKIVDKLIKNEKFKDETPEVE